MNTLLTPSRILLVVVLAIPACNKVSEAQHEEHHEVEHKVVVTSAKVKDVVTTQQYVCQIHSRRHIEVCALESGYLEEILVGEGQGVKQGETMFKILPTLYRAKLNADIAEARLAQIELTNTEKLHKQNVVSEQEVALAEAKLAKAQAKVELAQAELNFTDIKAPFDGIIDRLMNQQGSLIEEGDILTTLSDNSVMWVYFNVPEARYLEYKTELSRQQANTNGSSVGEGIANNDDSGGLKGDTQWKIELVLANGKSFEQPGKIGAIEADFNNETGNIAFRADFPNADGLLRHGQTGNILIHKVADDAIVIPQRATFEILDKRYVYLVDNEEVVHQREIIVQNEMEDIFVIKQGLREGDRIVIEGIRQVRDGEKVEYEFREPDKVLGDLKNEAE